MTANCCKKKPIRFTEKLLPMKTYQRYTDELATVAK